MNKATKLKLDKLLDKCEGALRNKARQSIDVWRGEMWAIVSACHELRKAGVLEKRPASASSDPPAIPPPGAEEP